MAAAPRKLRSMLWTPQVAWLELTLQSPLASATCLVRKLAIVLSIFVGAHQSASNHSIFRAAACMSAWPCSAGGPVICSTCRAVHNVGAQILKLQWHQFKPDLSSIVPAQRK